MERRRRELAPGVQTAELPAESAVEAGRRRVERRDQLAALAHRAQRRRADLLREALAAPVRHHRHRREPAHRHGAPPEVLRHPVRVRHRDQARAVEGAGHARRVAAQHRLAALGGDVEGVAVELPGLLELGCAKGPDLHVRQPTRERERDAPLAIASPRDAAARLRAAARARRGADAGRGTAQRRAPERAALRVRRGGRRLARREPRAGARLRRARRALPRGRGAARGARRRAAARSRRVPRPAGRAHGRRRLDAPRAARRAVRRARRRRVALRRRLPRALLPAPRASAPGLRAYESLARQRGFVRSACAQTPSSSARSRIPPGCCGASRSSRFGYRDAGWPEDYDLLLRLLAAGLRVGVVARRLLGWRVHAARALAQRSALRRRALHRVQGGTPGQRPARRTASPISYGATAAPVARSRRALDARGKSPAAIVEIHPRRLGRAIRGAPVISRHALGRAARRAARGVGGRAPSRAPLIRAELARLGWRECVDFVCAA